MVLFCFFTHRNKNFKKNKTYQKKQKLNDSLVSGKFSHLMENKGQEASSAQSKPVKSVFSKHIKSITSTADTSGWAKRHPLRNLPNEPTKHFLVSKLAG